MFNFVIYKDITVLYVSAIDENWKHLCKEVCDDIKYIRVSACSEVSPLNESIVKILNVYIMSSR